MTDNEIIKALELVPHCNVYSGECKKCPYRWVDDCATKFPKDALDLINRQKAGINERRCGGMKAWLVRVEDGDCATVVFAETRGKARALAQCTDACEDADFTDLEVSRVTHMDKYYTEGKKEMDWDNPKDRIALVKDCGFVCDYDYRDWADCENCSAKEYCDSYAEMKNGGEW